MDYLIEQFRKKLIDDANASGLPATVIMYVFKDIMEQSGMIANQQAKIQAQQEVNSSIVDTDQAKSEP